MLRGRGARFFSRSRGSREKTAAFTLIETLVVATIVIVIAVAGLVGFSAFRNKQALKGGLDELRAAAEATKRRSVVQEQGSRWGIRFMNATSGVSSYTTFKGASYSTSGVDRLYSFRGALGFGNPTASSTYDLVFSPLSGALSENKVLTIVSGRAGLIGDLILRTIGSITARTDNDVVVYWHFDEGTATTTYDASGNANTGTLTNGPTWQTSANCKAGQCLSFDGTNDYVTASHSSSLNVSGSSITIEAWVKFNAAATNQFVVEKGANIGKQYYMWWGYQTTICGSAANRLLVGYHDGISYRDYCYSWTPTIGTWYHLAWTANGSTVSIYINGASVASLSQTGSLQNTTTGQLNIGLNVGGSAYFNGNIDEVRIYNRALSATEIEAQYNDLK